MPDESGLKRMQRARLAQPFDGRDVIAIVHHGKGEACIDASPVQQNRTGTALAVIAAFLATGQSKMVPQRVKKCRARIKVERVKRAVDGKFYPHSKPFGWHLCQGGDGVAAPEWMNHCQSPEVPHAPTGQRTTSIGRH